MQAAYLGHGIVIGGTKWCLGRGCTFDGEAFVVVVIERVEGIGVVRDYWAIGIASPYKDAFGVKAIANLQIKGTYTLSVSGDYESCYKTEDGIIRHHILNPHTGYPENHYRVVSLKSTARSEVLDGLSTALFSISSIDKVLEIVSNVEERFNIEIALMLEKEVNKEKKKIDLYVTENYDALITKTNSTYFNSKTVI